MSFTLPPIPLLHLGGPEPTGGLYTHWVLDPKIAAYLFVVTGLYLAWVGPLNRRRPGVEQRPISRREILLFLLGTVSALIALGPPLDDWSHYFFVSAHMNQHLILMLVTVPCWLAGIPAWVYRPIIDRSWSFQLAKIITRPVVAFLGSTLIIIVWHVPVLYNGALDNELLHTLQHQFFILSGFWLWWPIMSKVPELPALSAPVKCLYLFLQTIPGGIVGAFITYSETILYTHYEDATQRPFGLGLKVDQEIAGLSMWVGTNVLYLVLISIIFIAWASAEERGDQERLRKRRIEAARIVSSGSSAQR
ncbi:MAG: cytochrome c oxidase assembly protein [Thermomicrobiales bacterium]